MFKSKISQNINIFLLKIFGLSRAVWGGLRKTMRRWHCGGEMKGEERGELLNSGDQDIAGWLEIKFCHESGNNWRWDKGGEPTPTWTAGMRPPTKSGGKFICLQRALKLSQIRPCAALPSCSLAGKLRALLSCFLHSSVLFYLDGTILTIIKSHFKAWKFLVSQQKSAKK